MPQEKFWKYRLKCLFSYSIFFRTMKHQYAASRASTTWRVHVSIHLLFCNKYMTWLMRMETLQFTLQ